MTAAIRRLGAGVAVLAAAASLQSAAQPAPASLPEALVAAFADTCLVEASTPFDEVVAAAGAAGWLDAEPEVHPELRAVLDIVEAAMEDLGEGAGLALFQRPTAYRNAILVLTQQPADATVTIGCSVYDFDGTDPIPVALLEALFGPPMLLSEDPPTTVVSQRWEPVTAYPALLEAVSTFIPEEVR
ncbi:MAG: hypothetical protein AB7O56_02265 [Bauldia sp.]